MKKIAKFYKVSKERFVKDWINCFGDFDNVDKLVEGYYDGLRLPNRATRGSAGYDFYLPAAIKLSPGYSMTIPTGIRVEIEDNWVLLIYPRSSLGFKYRMQLNNTVGIIDSDYFYSDNEGHIMLKIFNDSREDKVIELNGGMAFAQGIFVEYGVTVDDTVNAIRNGGFGSTTT